MACAHRKFVVTGAEVEDRLPGGASNEGDARGLRQARTRQYARAPEARGVPA